MEVFELIVAVTELRRDKTAMPRHRYCNGYIRYQWQSGLTKVNDRPVRWSVLSIFDNSDQTTKWVKTRYGLSLNGKLCQVITERAGTNDLNKYWIRRDDEMLVEARLLGIL